MLYHVLEFSNISQSENKRGPHVTSEPYSQYQGPTLCAKRLAGDWWDLRSGASLPGCQALFFVQSDSSAWVKLLFLPVPSPPRAMSPYHEKHCVHISPLHAAEPLWCRYTYPETITIEQMVQSVSILVFVCCHYSLTLCAFFFCFPRQTHRLNEHASPIFFTNFFQEQSV